MRCHRKLKKLLFCTILFCTFAIPQIQAGQELRLADLNPAHTALGVFHSYKHKILLVSLVQTGKAPFKCLPNQYYVYNYGTERYFEINAGNIKINSDFTKIFATRIHSLPGKQVSETGDRDQVLKMLSRTLKIPADIISAAQQKSSTPDRVCWQQPELLDIQNNRLRTFPFLAANLCQQQWCSELYWTNPSSIRLWIFSKPKQYQLVNLDVDKSTLTVKSRSPRFTRPGMPQLNAPRENLVTEKTLNGKVLVLKKNSGNTVKLEWHKETSGRIIVSLIRQGVDAKSAQKEFVRFRQQATAKSYDSALQLAEFILWLDPGNQTVKLERIKLYVSMSLMNRFFESLERDFSDKERFTACQKLHLDSSIRHLWKNDAFVEQFKKGCRL